MPEGDMTDDQTTYDRLAEHFPPEAHKTLQARGGQTYVPWNLVAGRLNDVLGVTGWSFSVEREGFTPNEAWVLGQLVATIDGEQCIRQQYGCADIMLGQSPNTDLLKKAGTDALKKCAQTLGVALYLTDPEERAEVQAAQQAQKRSSPRPLRTDDSGPKPTASSGPGDSSTVPISNDDTFTCEECGETLTETKFKSGDVWSSSQLAVFGRRKHAKTLCLTHYRAAANANKRAEEMAF